ncbi:hypothetical protein LEP1GSC133_0974 [Leptospira borgpetersenii serovar Pomona str. 200901868]|uniref:Uncharacterized protein n=1 Tax=Leptospira borgpetersenii serovar Pomona str. 200901868 TaxID=1192866 RepID=M6W4N1_LEPBO|nr:hypothetical protein LEP1GSC133_0974 [Leptospira borgpetersenii serovar Pomona str. 200901868]
MQLDLFDKVNWGFGIDSKFFFVRGTKPPGITIDPDFGNFILARTIPVLPCLRTGIVPFGSSNTGEQIENIKRHRVFLRDRKAE